MSNDEGRKSRRLRFPRRSLLGASVATAIGKVGLAGPLFPQPQFTETKRSWESQWDQQNDRAWIGADLWANPMHDWRLRDGGLECINAAPNRNVVLLTRSIALKPADFGMGVVIIRHDGAPISSGKGSAGFRVGLQGPLDDYRNALLYGKGLDVGITSRGKLFIGDPAGPDSRVVDLANAQVIFLSFLAKRNGEKYDLSVSAAKPNKESVFDILDAAANTLTKKNVPAADLAGGMSLVCNFGTKPNSKSTKAGQAGLDGIGTGRFRFHLWTVSGNHVKEHADRAFGPILFTQYTLSRGQLKLTAQMPPLGEQHNQSVSLAVGDRMLTAPIDPQCRTATFVANNWHADADVPYTVRYDEKVRAPDAEGKTHAFKGTIRREPLDKPTLTVADISCNTHAAFPNAQYVEHVKKLDPDLLAFVGDQFYESTGGYGVTTAPLDMAILDYLRKWYIHGWTWRDLMRDRPSISIPDDHDVYQGNIWGESGAPQTVNQEHGGYRMPPEWVNVVHRTQTSHHPDPYDKSSVKQGIVQYFGRMVYGGVDFAILADRMYKSAPEGKVPPTGGRGDHVTDPNFDPRTVDLPGLELLGASQEKFLAEWADDWSAADIKAVISQTIFTAMATHHGGQHEYLRADYDTNGWPQSARNRAVELIRQARAFHIAGDQHLPAVVQYGIKAARDAGYAFAGPAVNVGYPRWFEPKKPGENRAAGAPDNTGDFADSFGNPMTVVALANGEIKPRPGVLEGLADKASGLGIVRFDKARRKITIECWPLLVDPTAPDAKQFAGWPVTIDIPPKPTG